MRHHLPLTPERARHLYLTGFMGAGKSAVGKLLGMRLGWDFIDLDHAIVVRHGQTIAQIFETEGEAMFRRWENELFAEYAQSPQPMVLATGGGTLVDPTNFDLAQRTGITAYLVVDFPTALFRVAHGEDRPLMADGDALRNREHLRKLFHHRLPFYRMAEIHVDAAHGTAAEVAERLMSAMGALCTS